MPTQTPSYHRARKRHRFRTQAIAAIALLPATTNLLAGTASSAIARSGAAAHAARTLNDTATAKLHLVKPEGSLLTEEGPVSGKLAGSMRAQVRTGSVFTGNFTIHTHGATIKGRGRATPHGSGRYQSFHGSFTVTSGTGRYSHISGQAGLYGVFDRRTDAVVIQTTGTLTY